MIPEDELNLRIREKLQKEGRLPNEDYSEGVPMITHATVDDLLKLFQVRSTTLPEYVPSFYDEDEEYGRAFSNGLDIARDTLKRYVHSDPAGYLQQLSLWMKGSFKDSYSSKRPLLKDSAIVGTVFVTKAFELQFGPDILDDLDEVAPGVIKEAFSGYKPIEGKMALIDTLARSVNREIPPYQAFLINGIGQASRIAPAPSAFRDGALLQYSVLAPIWD